MMFVFNKIQCSVDMQNTQISSLPVHFIATAQWCEVCQQHAPRDDVICPKGIHKKLFIFFFFQISPPADSDISSPSEQQDGSQQEGNMNFSLNRHTLPFSQSLYYKLAPQTKRGCNTFCNVHGRVFPCWHLSVWNPFHSVKTKDHIKEI